MPNRVIRSGFLDSTKINCLKAEEQNLFIRLMLVADDYGCFDARPEMIRSYAYPVSDIRLSDVSKWLASCARVSLIRIYEDGGKKFLIILNFNQRQRAMRHKFPMPKDLPAMTDACQPDDGQMTDARRLDARASLESESESESESETKEREPCRFKKPSIEEIRAHCLERKNNINPEAFFAFYESKGWRVGNQTMKSWKAAIITWETRNKEKNKTSPISELSGRISFNDLAKNKKEISRA